MKKNQLEKITRHGENLNKIFNTGLEPVELCKKLRRLETKATRLTTDGCNYPVDHSKELEKIRLQACKILNTDIVFINGDPRGYALKISDKYVREHGLQIHRDMGGYGILAPEY